MNRHTRKNLKTDKFAQEVTNTFEFLSVHRKESTRYGAIALLVIALGVGYFYYSRHQATARADALAHALRVDDATVGQNTNIANLHYDTEEQKAKARTQAFADVAAKYRGAQEGAIAAFYLASDAADKGDLADAERRYKDILDSAPKAYASIARISLAQVYEGQGKNAEAEKLLREAVANPTVTVSKEAATVELARLLAKTKPEEAKKMLEPLRTERAAVSREAVAILGDISLNGK